jgi:hypothetical protein
MVALAVLGVFGLLLGALLRLPSVGPVAATVAGACIGTGPLFRLGWTSALLDNTLARLAAGWLLGFGIAALLERKGDDGPGPIKWLRDHPTAVSVVMFLAVVMMRVLAAVPVSWSRLAYRLVERIRVPRMPEFSS